MAFNDAGFDAPAGIQTDEFVLRPIRGTDVELDYEAVMESREFLRTWEQSTWPEDDFTVEDNRRDVERLERFHTEGRSFTYTVMNPTETRCLGCVYIFPTDAPFIARSDVTAVGNARWADYEAAVYFWIRKSRLADELDRRLLDSLRTWFELDWAFGRHLIVTSELFDQQVAMIERTELQLMFRLKDPQQPGRFLAYA